MVYIYTEDTTSCPDFVSTIIKVVIRPRIQYRIIKLNGAKNCNKFLHNIKRRRYSAGDVLIFYFDVNTLNNAYLMSAAQFWQPKGVTIYLQSFYCFESVFYTFRAFGEHALVNFGAMQQVFDDFKNCLLQKRSYRLFKQKYNRYLSADTTLETAANTIFVLCTNNIACVQVNKHKYTDLHTGNINKARHKAFYNGLCNTNIGDDVKRVEHGMLTYCKQCQKKQMCNITSTTTRKQRLKYFYENTCLSNPLLFVDMLGIHRSYQTLSTLLA